MRGAAGLRAARLLPLPHRLIQHHPRRHRHVQAFHGASHWNFDEQIAVLPRQAPHACTLGSHDDGEGTFEIDVVQRLFGLVVGADSPKPSLLEPFQSARKIDDLHERNRFSSSCGYLAHGGRQSSRTFSWDYHCTYASGICCAQASTQIVGILHAIQNEHQRLCARRIENIVQCTLAQRRGSHDVSDHTLVTPAAGKLIELLNRLDFDFYLSLARKAKDVFDALILTSALNENTRHTLRMTFQQGAH